MRALMYKIGEILDVNDSLKPDLQKSYGTENMDTPADQASDDAKYRFIRPPIMRVQWIASNCLGEIERLGQPLTQIVVLEVFYGDVTWRQWVK